VAAGIRRIEAVTVERRRVNILKRKRGKYAGAAESAFKAKQKLSQAGSKTLMAGAQQLEKDLAAAATTRAGGGGAAAVAEESAGVAVCRRVLDGIKR